MDIKNYCKKCEWCVVLKIFLFKVYMSMGYFIVLEFLECIVIDFFVLEKV